MSERCCIEFVEVGPQKLSWTATMPRPLTWHGLMREIRKHKALMSQDVAFDENEGIYVGGLRRVGTWRVKEIQPALSDREVRARHE